MSLKVAALCLDANLETLQPLCTRCLQADLCGRLHKGIILIDMIEVYSKTRGRNLLWQN